MTRRLDFIVTGTGRSGTSAVARYLSAVQGVHCGLELFSPWTDHRSLVPPDCFTDLIREDLPRGMRRPAAKLLQASLDEIGRRGDSIRHFGNKTPNYFFRLGGLLDEIAPARAIVCWRDLKAVAESYARRADDPKDSWDPGKRAIFAAADAMMCLKALAAVDGQRVMVVPNRAVVADWEAATRSMIAFLLPDLGEVTFDPANLAVIDRRLTKTRSVSRPLPNWTNAELRAIETVEGSGADALMNRDSVFLLGDVLADLQGLVAELPADVLEHTRKLTEEDGRELGIQHFAKWSRMSQHNKRVAARDTGSGSKVQSARK